MNNTRKSEVEEYFNKEAQSWRDRYSKGDFESVSYQDRMSAALQLLREHGRKDMLVLDAGCGAGLQAGAIRKAGHDVFACDIAYEMVRRARDTISVPGERRVFVADLERCPVRAGSFDAIVILGVLGYAEQPDKILEALRQMLKPNGLLVISMASEGLLLSRIADIVSLIPNKLYLALKRLVIGKQLPAPGKHESFYKKNYRYMRPSQFDRLLESYSFRKRGSMGVNYGRLHFMDKRFLPERADIFVSRCVGRVARAKPFRFIQEYSRIYVVCAERT